MSLEFRDQVAIVTGAGNGLGKSYAIALAARGARIVVNDIGGNLDGTGGSPNAAEAVVKEIISAGGEAVSSTANVCDELQVSTMVESTMARWGRVDILINNAGIVRNDPFQEMSLDDWRSVIDVHLNGSAYCCHAVWPIMREQNYGRIVMTSSTSGIYGIGGHANYAAAKLGAVGLMNVLHIEGKKHNVHVNCISPTAATRMTEDVMTKSMLGQISPEHVVPAVLFLTSTAAPSRTILLAGAGTYSVAKIIESEGIKLPQGSQTPEVLIEAFSELCNIDSGVEILSGMQHVERIVNKEISPSDES